MNKSIHFVILEWIIPSVICINQIFLLQLYSKACVPKPMRKANGKIEGYHRDLAPPPRGKPWSPCRNFQNFWTKMSLLIISDWNFNMGIYEIFHRYKGDPSDVETFLNLLLFVAEYPVWNFQKKFCWWFLLKTPKVSTSLWSRIFLEKSHIVNFLPNIVVSTAPLKN